MAQCRCGHDWSWHTADPAEACRCGGCSCPRFIEAEPGNDATTIPRPSPGRVLVVDDEQIVRELFRRILESAGYQVRVAANGEEGLALLRSDPAICLVLLDVRMPTMDGPAFRKAQRQDPRLASIPTVIVSGSPIADALREELRAAGHLVKPVEREQLLQVVERYCGLP